MRAHRSLISSKSFHKTHTNTRTHTLSLSFHFSFYEPQTHTHVIFASSYSLSSFLIFYLHSISLTLLKPGLAVPNFCSLSAFSISTFVCLSLCLSHFYTHKHTFAEVRKSLTLLLTQASHSSLAHAQPFKVVSFSA